MSLSRRAIVAASQSVWLREHAMRWRFVRRASKRFLPGERAEDALAAASELAALGISAMPSRVGENITVASEANAVAEHYVGVLAQMRAANLPGSLSIKPTQLGLDLDAELCYRNLMRILEAAARFALPTKSGIIWIDMESSAYVDRTLELFRRVRATYSNVGVCLQAYLRRTPADLESLVAAWRGDSAGERRLCRIACGCVSCEVRCGRRILLVDATHVRSGLDCRRNASCACDTRFADDRANH